MIDISVMFIFILTLSTFAARYVLVFVISQTAIRTPQLHIFDIVTVHLAAVTVTHDVISIH